MWVLIRNRQSGIVADVEIFKTKKSAIDFATNYWSDGIWDMEERIAADLDLDRYYEDDNFIISLHQRVMKP